MGGGGWRVSRRPGKNPHEPLKVVETRTHAHGFQKHMGACSRLDWCQI